jgi:hypothetical protein
MAFRKSIRNGCLKKTVCYELCRRYISMEMVKTIEIEVFELHLQLK